ncbi:hypothetical protein ACTXT7_012743 [Hymenolepis weldensis]
MGNNFNGMLTADANTELFKLYFLERTLSIWRFPALNKCDLEDYSLPSASSVLKATFWSNDLYCYSSSPMPMADQKALKVIVMKRHLRKVNK